MYTLDQPTKINIQNVIAQFEKCRRFSKTKGKEQIMVLENRVCDKLRSWMKVATPDRREKLCHIRAKTAADIDSVYSLASYHCKYINDILRTIRRGEIDYVYNPEWLFEIYYYEPKMQFRLRDGAYLVWARRDKGDDV